MKFIVMRFYNLFIGMKTKNYILGIVLLFVLSFCVACNPPVSEEDSAPIHYDTLTLIQGDWIAEITHINYVEGQLIARLSITMMYLDSLDSIPYTNYNNLELRAMTSDTLLPCGIYTSKSKDLICTSDKYSRAWGRGSGPWYKKSQFYQIKDASIHIGKDSTQGYYLDAFIQMYGDENLYNRCTYVLRYCKPDNLPDIFYLFPYYPDSEYEEFPR